MTTRNGVPAIHATDAFGHIENLEQSIEEAQNRIDPFNPENDIGRVPFYSTGARSLIKVGGRSIGVSPSVRWSVSYNGTYLNTIDTPHAWDIDVGPMRVAVDMRLIMDPTKGPEHDGMFSIMKAAVHQPMVEIQVLDKQLGTSLFFARGVFLEVAGDVSIGNISTFQARFMGTAYQHYASQDFQAYDTVSGTASALIDGLQDLASDLTGGLF